MSRPALAPDAEEAFARATAAAARAVLPLVGGGDARGIDGAAVDALRASLRDAPVTCRVVTGEGAKDDAPMLAPGELLGAGTAVDIAVDPVDGTSAAAGGHAGAIAAIGLCPGGCMYDPGPMIYCERIVVGPSRRPVELSFERPLSDLLADIADARDKPVAQLRVALLERPRNAHIAAALLEAGVTPVPMPFADLAALAAVAVDNGKLDALLGIGGVPETIAGACAVVAGNAQMLMRPYARDDADREALARAGVALQQARSSVELVGPSAAFVASGITDSVLLSAAGESGVHTLGVATGRAPAYRRL